MSPQDYYIFFYLSISSSSSVVKKIFNWYLLGVDKKDNNKKGSEAAQLAKERWEESLMASTSLSQLFLHFSTLGKILLDLKYDTTYRIYGNTV